MDDKEKYLTTSFSINYKKEIVKFKRIVFEKKKMGLKEFAIIILQIEPVSTEVIAMFIGKQAFDVYNKREKCEIMFNKKTRNGIKGKIKVYEK